MPKPKGDIRIFSGVGRCRIQRHLVKGDLSLAGAQKLLDGDWLMTEIKLRQLIHAMPAGTRGNGIGHQHGVTVRHLNAATACTLQIKFGVLQHLQHGRILQERCQCLQRLTFTKL